MWLPLFLPPSFSSNFYFSSIIPLKLFSLLLLFLFLFLIYISTCLIPLSPQCNNKVLLTTEAKVSATYHFHWHPNATVSPALHGRKMP